MYHQPDRGNVQKGVHARTKRILPPDSAAISAAFRKHHARFANGKAASWHDILEASLPVMIVNIDTLSVSVYVTKSINDDLMLTTTMSLKDKNTENWTSYYDARGPSIEGICDRKLCTTAEQGTRYYACDYDQSASRRLCTASMSMQEQSHVTQYTCLTNAA